jgi:hypothetical protein
MNQAYIINDSGDDFDEVGGEGSSSRIAGLIIVLVQDNKKISHAGARPRD